MNYYPSAMNYHKIRGKGNTPKGTKFIKSLYFSTMQAPNCLNCEHPVSPQQNFCSTCGQQTAAHRLSLHDVSHDALHYFTHADKGIFSLLWQLLKKPGVVAREYVAGKRRKYFPPLNFFLIVAAMYVFMLNTVAPSSKEQVIPVDVKAKYENIKDPVTKAQVGAILERRVKSSQFISRYANFVAMIATPLIALFLWLFYRKGRYNYTEHLVANMYFSGFTVLSFALVFGPIMRLLNLGGGFNVVLLSFFVFEVGYRSISYYYFIHKKTTASAVKAVLTSIAVIFIWFILVFATIYFYVSSGFWGLLS